MKTRCLQKSRPKKSDKSCFRSLSKVTAKNSKTSPPAPLSEKLPFNWETLPLQAVPLRTETADTETTDTETTDVEQEKAKKIESISVELSQGKLENTLNVDSASVESAITTEAVTSKIEVPELDTSPEQLLEQEQIEEQTEGEAQGSRVKTKTAQPIPLPYRSVLEHRLGQPLGDVVVYADTPGIHQALEQLQTSAVTQGNRIFLKHRHANLETVAHEVIHVLQARCSHGTTANQPASAVAEQEAEQEAAAITAYITHPPTVWAPPQIQAQLSTMSLACFQSAAASSTAQTDSIAQAKQSFEQTLARRSIKPQTAVEAEPSPRTADTETRTSQPQPSQTQPLAPAGPNTFLTVDTDPAAKLQEPSGEIELTPPPQPGISEAEVKAQKEKIEAARAALTDAKTAEALTAALAIAPPTVKAEYYNKLGTGLSQTATQEQQAFTEAVPAYSAKLSDKTQPAPTLSSLDNLAVKPAPTAPDAPPAPVLSPEPQSTQPYVSDPATLKSVETLPAQPSPQRSEQLAKTLDDIPTKDPGVETSLGKRPDVPTSGDSNPQLVQQQSKEQAQNAQAAKADAAQQVLNGTGPEAIKPQAIEQTESVSELTPVETNPPVPVAGIESFKEIQLPPEVQTAFDNTHQAAMQASLEKPKQKAAELTQQRDTEQQKQLDTAKDSIDSQNKKAQQQQAETVKASQRSIQQQRLKTLNEQKQVLKQATGEIGQKKLSEDKAIAGRIKTDEEKVSSEYAQTEKTAQQEVAQGEKNAKTKKEKAKEKAKEESWFGRALSFLKEKFSDLTKAIKGIFNKIRKTVNDLLDKAQKFAIGLINKTAGWVKQQINKFATFAKGVVNGLLKEHFPKLAKKLNDKIDGLTKKANAYVDKAAKQLKAGVKATVKGLKAGLNKVLNTFERGLNGVVSVVSAVMTGDWRAVLKMALEAVLKAIGINPEEFYKFVGRAENTFKEIVKNPLAFAKNLVDAFLLGFKNFGKKFLGYLKTGIIGWLTGALSSASIEIPKKFDLLGVLDLVRQVLGLTIELLRKKAVKLVGAKNVERVEFVIGHLQNLIAKGWNGLLNEIKDSFSGLQEQVLGSIRDFLVTRIVLTAVTKLGSLLNPAGAIVQLVLTIWNVYTFVRDQLGRMVEMVKAVVESIERITKKEFKPAAKKVEEVLANSLPLAIDLLAKLLGLGGIGKKVQDILKRVQKKIDKAVDKLLAKIVKLFQKKKAKDSKGLSHKQMAQNAAKALKAKKKEKDSYDILRQNLLREAKRQEKKYNRMLQKPIKMKISFLDPVSDKKDKDLDFKVRVAPNDEEVIDAIQTEIDTLGDVELDKVHKAIVEKAPTQTKEILKDGLNGIRKDIEKDNSKSDSQKQYFKDGKLRYDFRSLKVTLDFLENISENGFPNGWRTGKSTASIWINPLITKTSEVGRRIVTWGKHLKEDIIFNTVREKIVNSSPEAERDDRKQKIESQGFGVDTYNTNFYKNFTNVFHSESGFGLSMAAIKGYALDKNKKESLEEKLAGELWEYFNNDSSASKLQQYVLNHPELESKLNEYVLKAQNMPPNKHGGWIAVFAAPGKQIKRTTQDGRNGEGDAITLREVFEAHNYTEEKLAEEFKPHIKSTMETAGFVDLEERKQWVGHNWEEDFNVEENIETVFTALSGHIASYLFQKSPGHELYVIRGTDIPRTLKQGSHVKVNKAHPDKTVSISSSRYTRIVDEARAWHIFNYLKKGRKDITVTLLNDDENSPVVKKRKIQIHHTVPLYLGGGHEFSNLLAAFGKRTDKFNQLEFLGHAKMHEIFDNLSLQPFGLDNISLSSESFTKNFKKEKLNIVFGILFATGKIIYHDDDVKLIPPGNNASNPRR